MPNVRTARERAREELTREIKDEARRQLASHGAEGLSLRAVSRELGMVPSALYRYYPSRDDLLTALIIDAYNAIGEHVEQAADRVRRTDYLGRWRAACNAVREWALANPREYALVYGSPVVGYRAPRETTVPAARVPIVLLQALADSHEAGKLAEVTGPFLSRAAARQVDLVVEVVDQVDLKRVPKANLAVMVAAWTQLYGVVSFELFGHLEGVIDDKQVMFEYTTSQLAHLVGLRRG